MLSRSTQRLVSRLRPLPSLPTPVSQAPARAQSRCFAATRLRPSSAKSSASDKAAPAPRYPSASLAVLFAGAASFCLAYQLSQQSPTRCDYHSEDDSVSDLQGSSLPCYRIDEVRKHDARSDHPWIIHRDKVYDITEWIGAHPGGDIILRAAGGSIDRYWDIFAIHKNDYVYDILNQYLIGYVDPEDLVNGRPSQDEIEDPSPMTRLDIRLW
ncbi:hypothetical protein NXS19_012672 [Fusarium pseudograminearum]|nr:hypothetical protein NXS19_012672 [Fusarium pseudograminearum]